MARLSGRRAIVTGAGSGIGAAVAARLVADGAQVFSADIQGPVDFACDLTEPDANARLVAAAVEAMGGAGHRGALCRDQRFPCAGRA